MDFMWDYTKSTITRFYWKATQALKEIDIDR